MINRKSVHVSLEHVKLVQAKVDSPGPEKVLSWESIMPRCGIDWETEAYAKSLKIHDIHIEDGHGKSHLNTARTSAGLRRVIGYIGDGDIQEYDEEEEEESVDEEMKCNDLNKNRKSNRKRRGKGKSVTKYKSYLLPNFEGAKTNKITLIRRSVYGTEQRENPYFRLYDTKCRVILMFVNKNHSNNLHCFEGIKKGEKDECNVASIGWVRVAVGESNHFNIVYAPNTFCKKHKKQCKIFNYLREEDKLHLGEGDKVWYKDEGKYKKDNSHHYKYAWYTLVPFKASYDTHDTSHFAFSKKYHVSAQLLRVS